MQLNIESNNRFGYGFWFNGHHSTEFGVDVIEPKELGFPAKIKQLVEIPFSNIPLDLSYMYQDQQYGERTFKWTLLVHDRSRMDKEGMYVIWTKLVNWLENTQGKTKLKDDVMSDYYYLAEIQTATSWEEFRYHGKMTIEFQCYPFRIHEALEGNDIWDDFNFELDVAQETKFDVSGSKSVMLFNVGTPVASPTIVASAPFTLKMGNQTVTVPAGTSDSPDFVLANGINQIVINGIGTIEFQWHKELI